uniref:Uncharacterized protein n=1 Tax=Strigamia maritima TaxID=126957 RepID=T1IJA8_STRMM
MMSRCAMMNRIEQRKKTFHNWPAYKCNVDSQAPARAGFIYLGEEDSVECVYCFGRLKQWAYNERPILEHYLWFPYRPLMKMMF